MGGRTPAGVRNELSFDTCSGLQSIRTLVMVYRASVGSGGDSSEEVVRKGEGRGIRMGMKKSGTRMKKWEGRRTIGNEKQ